MLELNKIYQGDCIELMKQIDDNSINAIITDPPYGIDYLSSWTNNHKKLENDSNIRIDELYSKILPEFKRILKDDGVICCCCGGGGKRPVVSYATLELIKYFELIQTVIWSKGKTDGSFVGLGWKYRPSYETIIVGAKSKDKYAFYPQYASNVFVCRPEIPREWDHPTKKPLKLMEFFISNHTKEGDLILDPFCGGGSTLVAAKHLWRDYIGIELESKYIDIANKRLDGMKGQIKIFDD